MYHSQFQDPLDFFLHAAPSESQVPHRQGAKVPWCKGWVKRTEL